ncbi:MAG: hypothetical protein J6S71_08255 [Clostridia bacterium]|nr:hypothetical protein [Clostridia bacterium]
MQYDVIVKAEISRSTPTQALPDMTSQIGALLAEIFSKQITILSEGVLRSTRVGRIVLNFKVEGDREITVSFSKKDPGLISLKQRGAGPDGYSTIFLEEDTKRKCIGKDPRGNRMEFSVTTQKVENKLLKSGKLKLEYMIDICGVRAEISRLSLTVTHDKIKENQNS